MFKEYAPSIIAATPYIMKKGTRNKIKNIKLSYKQPCSTDVSQSWSLLVGENHYSETLFPRHAVSFPQTLWEAAWIQDGVEFLAEKIEVAANV